MKTVTKEYEIHAPAETVWKCLVERSLIEKWSGSNVEMTDREGEDFSLWNGDIYGKNIKVERNKKLVQEWFAGKKWNKASIVKFALEDKGTKTLLQLVHEDIPDAEAEGISCGWDDFFLKPLKALAESK